jgi:RNA binding protein fox-1
LFLAVGKFPNTVSGIMQMALGIAENWCNGLGLSVNPDKTGIVAFTRKRKLEGLFEHRIVGRKLQSSGSVKYLGVILDSRLTWREHVDVRVRKAQNSLWACRRACGGTWGLGPKVFHWLYTSVIRPSVTFASLVW